MKLNPKKQAATEEQSDTYERLGKSLIKAIERDNIQVSTSWRQFITLSFTKGLFMGLGSVVGATILVALVLWLLNAFDWLPVVGEWLERFSGRLEEGVPIE